MEKKSNNVPTLLDYFLFLYCIYKHKHIKKLQASVMTFHKGFLQVKLPPFIGRH